MFRKVLTILSLVGLLLSVGLWGASYFVHAVRIVRSTPITPHWNIYLLNRGCIRRCVATGFRANIFGGSNFAVKTSEGVWLYIPVSGAAFSVLLGKSKSAHYFDYTGFKGLKTRWTPSLSFKPFRFSLPLWMVTGSFAAVACYLYFLPGRARRRRKKLGLCVKCGYDLRGSAERCPECGASFGEVMMFSRRRVFVPRFSGELELRALPDDWAAALESRVQEGFLVRGNHARSNYRICSSSKDSVTIRADDWWTAINVGLNEVRLRRESDRRITFEVSFWRWTGYAAMLGMIIFAPLLGIFVFTDWMKPWLPPNRLEALGSLSIGIFFCLCWPWILTEFHKKPAAKCLERILHETFTDAAQ